MNNYVYIISSLPQIGIDDRSRIDFDDIREQITSQLKEKDLLLCQTLENGFDPDKLGRDFYIHALESRNAFIKGYFRYDLLLRNCKVQFINKELERPLDRDVLDIDDWDSSDEKSEIERALSVKDLLSREKALDSLLWEKSEELVLNHIFDIDIILSFLARLHVVERWMVLDEESGRQMFRKLINELKESYTI